MTPPAWKDGHNVCEKCLVANGEDPRGAISAVYKTTYIANEDFAHHPIRIDPLAASSYRPPLFSHPLDPHASRSCRTPLSLFNMTTHSHALIAAAAPLIGLTSALPQHYVSRPVLVEDAFRSSPEKEGITIKLVSLEEPKDEQGSSNYEGASVTECATDGKFTYFSEQPLPGAENDSILIEECDPSDPNQIRLAYVANRSFKNKLSPTSILIGCTGTSPKSFKARNGGAFAKITSSGTYTNFVKRNFAAVNTIPIVKSAGDKRTQQLQVEDGNSRLARRWETRSDIDQYSDGYHTCQSAGSSACRLIVPKQVCPDLQKALEGRFFFSV